ncbi:glycine cleavage system protein GcvH [Kitasatospora aureofaciens]|uniref:glycine cleavage system protein GcvH n=1 Tax=Kitasatospora aureofaciens TaxID=1894 RepID=UPI001C465731|nr:glycine cleavage system protein GcvH [Kitasatospora aureofaciens]MBV6700455.1 glycine cleavage system protein GcvH [Kitasatospora aureofaciens]
MTPIPDDLKYTRDHEWVRSVEKGRVRVGITAHAQHQLGDIVFVELPKVGERLEAGDPFGTVESVKAVTEVYAPLAGVIASVNGDLSDDPELLNEDAYSDGWMIEITPAKDSRTDGLLTAAQYQAYISDTETD